MATTIGVGLGITPLALLPTLAIWIIVFIPSHYVSLASIVSMMAFPVIACIVGYNFYTILFAAIICSLSIFKHKENIKRLLKGEEPGTHLKK